MTRRLVELNAFFYSKEVDRKRLLREARDLRDYLLKLDPKDDQHDLRRRVLPFCEEALKGTLQLPVNVRQQPVDTTRILDIGGLLPDGFEELYARFFNTATGARAEVAQRFEKDGKTWAWMDFED